MSDSTKDNKNKDVLDDLLTNNSFKIKPIFIELKNYSYFHAAISNNTDDYNKRFVGRSKLIKKIQSFIFESSKNTGTYLISGFRGMGKTSLVNKALSSLNPKSKLNRYILLWFLLLPFVFINENLDRESIFSDYSKWILALSFIYIFFILFNSSRLIKFKTPKVFFTNIKLFFKDIFNPDFQRDKYNLYKNFTYFYFYFLITPIFLYYFSKNSWDYHSKFWFINSVIILIYILTDLYNEISKLPQKSEKISKLLPKTWRFSYMKTWRFVYILIIIISLGVLVKNEYTISPLYFLVIIGFYLFFKICIKCESIKKENIKYKTVFSRIFSFVNLKQYIVVNINLSKEKLTEKDVLKYITNEISNEYRKWYYDLKNVKRVLSVFSLTFMLFFIINSFYDLIPNNYIYKQTNEVFQVSKYFPSQLFLENENVYQQTKEGKKNSLHINNYKNDLDSIKKGTVKILIDSIPINLIDKYKVGYKSIDTTLQISSYTLNVNPKNTNSKEKIDKYEYSYFNNFKFHLAKTTNFIDYLFVNTYSGIRTTIIGRNVDRDTLHYKLFNIAYPEDPPLIVFIIFFSVFIFYRLLPVQLLPINTHISSLRALKTLQNQIDASIIVENNSNASIGSSSIFNFSKKTAFQPLESKDISQRLIHILDKINSIKPFFTQINFIIIFDELDKINADYNSSISNKEDEFDGDDENKFHARRKERINKILSSMKYFLNTAKVKSIFIAGREMYDAALAGISDRESNLDSIFSDNKIYVNSFYTEADDNNLKDITSMTEQYVCQFIIPQDYIDKHKDDNVNLKMYNNYLKEKNNENKFKNDLKFKKLFKNIEKLKNSFSLKCINSIINELEQINFEDKEVNIDNYAPLIDELISFYNVFKSNNTKSEVIKIKKEENDLIKLLQKEILSRNIDIIYYTKLLNEKKYDTLANKFKKQYENLKNDLEKEIILIEKNKEHLNQFSNYRFGRNFRKKNNTKFTIQTKTILLQINNLNSKINRIEVLINRFNENIKILNLNFNSLILMTEKSEFNNILLNKELIKFELFKQQRIKTISTLKDFIKYLTYRSNGAPRKLSNLFDQYVNSYTLTDLRSNNSDYNDKLVYADNEQSMCLKFAYYDQYKFSFISYLITPIFLGLGHHMSDYSDKLLVSISYMLDHLFKHHKFGLSYRSLSLTPEIIDVNKEPEFRTFLDKLIGFLSKSHLRKIVSGIYDYKFQGKIASELKFISKINELEAAAFNFTLDESVELKKYFHKKIKQLEKKYQNDNLSINDSDVYEDYVNSVSLIYMQIGDLHFNDEEYGEAIENYLEALQVIRQREVKDMLLYEFILFVRNKLKLGLAFEKNKMYDSAEMTYAELTSLILQKRNIPIRKLGLVRFVFKNNSYRFNKLVIKNRTFIKEILDSKGIKYEDNVKSIAKAVKENLVNDKPEHDVVVVGRPKPDLLSNFDNTSDKDWKKLYDIKDMETFYGFNDEYVITNIDDFDINYKPLKRNYDFTTAENIRLLYQPIIAKLHLTEKSTPNRVKDIDLIRAIKEFNFFKRPLKTDEKRVIVAEFYNKIGDLLYFKNGTVNNTLKHVLLKENPDILTTPIDAMIFYTKSLSILLIPRHFDEIYQTPKHNKFFTKMEKIKTLDYYKFGNDNNAEFLFFFKNLNETIINIKLTLEHLHKEKIFIKKHTSEYLTSVANGVIDLAGALLSFVDKTKIKNTFVKEINVTLDDCLELFYQANIIYTRIGEHRLAKSQLIKILHLLRDKKKSTTSFFLINQGFTVEDIVNTCIKYIYRTYDQATRPEIKKVRNFFSIEKGSHTDIYKSTTIMAEIDEIIYLYWLLKARDVVWEDIKKIKKIVNYTYLNTNPYSNINKKYNRILELTLRIKVNKNLITKFLKNNEIDYDKIRLIYKYIKGQEPTIKNKELYKTLKMFIIVDSIGAANEILKSHELFDINYVTTNNLGLAKAHTNMGFWCNEFENYKLNNPNLSDTINDKVKTIINSINLMYISSNYHFDLAQQYNYTVKNYHHRGIPLNDFLKNNAYLDDFYNDNLVHFSIAVERNNLYENMDKNITDLKELSNSKENVNNLERYFYS